MAHSPAPSIVALSVSSCGTPWKNERRTITLNPLTMVGTIRDQRLSNSPVCLTMRYTGMIPGVKSMPIRTVSRTGRPNTKCFRLVAYASRQETNRLSPVPITVTKMLTARALVTTPPLNSAS
jgi:hypothetical protein